MYFECFPDYSEISDKIEICFQKPFINSPPFSHYLPNISLTFFSPYAKQLIQYAKIDRLFAASSRKHFSIFTVIC